MTDRAGRRRAWPGRRRWSPAPRTASAPPSPQALRADGAEVHGVDKDTADLTSPDAVREFFAGLGAVDILVNNAGGVCGQVGRPLEEVTGRRLARGGRRQPDQRVPVHPRGSAGR